MQRILSLKPPFFEFGPKAYLYGERMVSLAQAIDAFTIEHDIDVILTVGYTDIGPIAAKTKRLNVFASHMDPIRVGPGSGAVLPEAIREAGAVGVQLNHAEKPLSAAVLEKTIMRAKEVGLATMVCADSLEDVKRIARLGPTVLVAEPTELIGSGQAVDETYVRATVAAAKDIDPEILVLPAAGISNGEDVYRIIALGAEATGCSSGIAKADSPAAVAGEMIRSVRRAWNDTHGTQGERTLL